MKKLAIISIIVGVISVTLTVAFFIMKLNNNELVTDNLPKKVCKIESKKTEKKKSEEKKVKKTDDVQKIETKVKQANKIKYKNGKIPNFIGCNQIQVYEFAKEHGIKYELSQAVPTPVYNLKGTVAKQSIEAGKDIKKEETLKISIYIFDGHYNPVVGEDPCHDENGNLIKSSK